MAKFKIAEVTQGSNPAYFLMSAMTKKYQGNKSPIRDFFSIKDGDTEIDCVLTVNGIEVPLAEVLNDYHRFMAENINEKAAALYQERMSTLNDAIFNKMEKVEQAFNKALVEAFPEVNFDEDED